MVVDVGLRNGMDFGRLLLQLVGWRCKNGFPSAEETQFPSFATGFVQDTLSS